MDDSRTDEAIAIISRMLDNLSDVDLGMHELRELGMFEEWKQFAVIDATMLALTLTSMLVAWRDLLNMSR